MTAQDLGSLGELVGGIGVIASLVHLAIQIRHNTRGLDQNSDRAMALAVAGLLYRGSFVILRRRTLPQGEPS
jgi:hypothetical protein